MPKLVVEESKDGKPLEDEEEDEDMLETDRPQAIMEKRESELFDTELMNQIVNENPSVSGLNSPTKRDQDVADIRLDKFLEADKAAQPKEQKEDEMLASHNDIEKEWKELEDKV